MSVPTSDRRTNVVVFFPNKDVVTRLFGAILVGQNEEVAVRRAQYMTLDSIASMSDNVTV